WYAHRVRGQELDPVARCCHPPDSTVSRSDCIRHCVWLSRCLRRRESGYSARQDAFVTRHRLRCLPVGRCSRALCLINGGFMTTSAPRGKLRDGRAYTSEEWLAWRRTGIGGSDAPVIMGLSPYRGLLSLYVDKKDLGLDPREPME